MNTQEPFVITISREVGSGGHTVGSILAEKLNVRYCDKQLLSSLMKQFDLSASAIERLKGQKKNWLADFINKVSPMPSAQALGLNPRYTQEFRLNVTTDDIFEAEVEILKGFAEMGSCVIAGRSGFFVLEDGPNKVDVFITAPRERRIARVMQKQEVSRAEAERVIDKVDKTRDNYVKRYTGRSRYDARNYDLVINMMEGMTEDEAVEVILAYVRANAR